jgi:hypothetical protein
MFRSRTGDLFVGNAIRRQSSLRSATKSDRGIPAKRRYQLLRMLVNLKVDTPILASDKT